MSKLEQFSAQLFASMEGYVLRAVEPLFARLAALEARQPEKGDKGDAGLDGNEGLPGKDGIDGKDGRDGVDGIAGKDGIDGKDGAPGKDGEPGADGAPGKDGIEGKDGAIGVSGKDGRDGVDGIAGKDGIDGKDGPTGKDGERGLDGAAGKDGRDGLDGKDGADGIEGKDGLPGKDGVDGLDGAAGENGRDGKDGDPEALKGFIASEVAKAVALIPQVKNGEPGKDAFDRDILPAIEDEKSYPRGTLARHKGGVWRAVSDTNGMRGWECVWNGISLATQEQIDERTVEIVLALSDGAESKLEIKLLHPLDRGVFHDGNEYQRGDGVTWAGSWWIAQVEGAKEKPGTGPEWRLAVRRGREGKEGRPAPAKAVALR